MAGHGYEMCMEVHPTREEYSQPFSKYVQSIFRKHPDLPVFKASTHASSHMHRWLPTVVSTKHCEHISNTEQRDNIESWFSVMFPAAATCGNVSSQPTSIEEGRTPVLPAQHVPPACLSMCVQAFWFYFPLLQNYLPFNIHACPCLGMAAVALRNADKSRVDQYCSAHLSLFYQLPGHRQRKHYVSPTQPCRSSLRRDGNLAKALFQT